MKNVQPFMTIDYRQNPPDRELRLYEIGETVYACILEDCDWMGSVPIFAPPTSTLAEIFGEDVMSLVAKNHHNYEAERLCEQHYMSHVVSDYIRTIVGLRDEIDAKWVHLVNRIQICSEAMPGSAAGCDRVLGHEELHAGVDRDGYFHTWPTGAAAHG